MTHRGGARSPRPGVEGPGPCPCPSAWRTKSSQGGSPRIRVPAVRADAPEMTHLRPGPREEEGQDESCPPVWTHPTPRPGTHPPQVADALQQRLLDLDSCRCSCCRRSSNSIARSVSLRCHVDEMPWNHPVVELVLSHVVPLRAAESHGAKWGPGAFWGPFDGAAHLG